MEDTFDSDMSPLFEAYGKACYAGQSLEMSFRFLLILNETKHAQGESKKSAVEKIDSETANFTLNRIFRKAQEKEYFSKKEIDILIKANQLRNHIIHEYWRNNLEGIKTPTGRLKIKTELKNYAKQLRAADQITVGLIDNYLIEYGMTTNILKSMVDRDYEEGPTEAPPVKH